MNFPFCFHSNNLNDNFYHLDSNAEFIDECEVENYYSNLNFDNYLANESSDISNNNMIDEENFEYDNWLNTPIFKGSNLNLKS